MSSRNRAVPYFRTGENELHVDYLVSTPSMRPVYHSGHQTPNHHHVPIDHFLKFSLTNAANASDIVPLMSTPILALDHSGVNHIFFVTKIHNSHIRCMADATSCVKQIVTMFCHVFSTTPNRLSTPWCLILNLCHPSSLQRPNQMFKLTFNVITQYRSHFAIFNRYINSQQPQQFNISIMPQLQILHRLKWHPSMLSLHYLSHHHLSRQPRPPPHIDCINIPQSDISLFEPPESF